MTERGSNISFWFAGVCWNLSFGDAELISSFLAHDSASFADFDLDLTSLARVTVTHQVASVPSEPTTHVRWCWMGDETELIGFRSSARIRQKQVNAFDALVRTPPSAAALWEAIQIVSSAVLSKSGAAVMHAAGVEFQDHALLFIGPSGSGKSTATSLVSSARWFCIDRAVLLPSNGKWLAAALPWGNNQMQIQRSERRLLPLGGLLKVIQDPLMTRIDSCDLVESVLWIRESLHSPNQDPAAEASSLEIAELLAKQTNCGKLRFGLASELSVALTEWLNRPDASLV